jgi:hypothetical protein
MEEKSSRVCSPGPLAATNHSHFWLNERTFNVRVLYLRPPQNQPFIKLRQASSPPPMSSSTTSSSNFRPIFDAALSDYAKQTGIDLSTHPFAQTLQDSTSPDAIIDLLGDKAKQFQAYRDGNRKLINCLKPVVQVLHTVSGILGEVAALVSRNGSCCLI